MINDSPQPTHIIGVYHLNQYVYMAFPAVAQNAHMSIKSAKRGSKAPPYEKRPPTTSVIASM